jgi:acylphosphatase
MIRIRKCYTGRVQGVGFRATTVSISNRFRVDGFVRNLADGRVEVVVQGQADEVEPFLSAIESAMGSNIRDSQQENLEPIEPSGRFRVEY